MKESFETNIGPQKLQESNWDKLAGQTKQEHYQKIGKKTNSITLRKKGANRQYERNILENVSNSWYSDPDIENSQSFMHNYNLQIGEITRDQRRQEFLERTINESLPSFEELIGMLESGAELSSKRYEKFGEKNIPVYNTGNLDFNYLSHSIEYSGTNDRNYSLLKDPSLWDLTESQARSQLGIGTFSNMLSLTYNNSNQYKIEAKTIRYGLLRLPPNSVCTFSTAGQSLNKKRETDEDLWLADRLTKAELLKKVTISTSNFMEIQNFRYDEDGNPQFRPSFIIARESGTDQDALRQAAYFDAPIFEIPTEKIFSEEEKKEKERLQNLQRLAYKYIKGDSSNEDAILELATKPPEQWSLRERLANKNLYMDLLDSVNNQ
jgi:hypothetical protein